MSRTKTETVVRTRQALDHALRQVGLTAEEENVLRMRYGVTLDEGVALEFVGQDRAETRAQLQDLERRALVGVAANRIDSGRRASIIERMKRL